MTSTLPK